MRIKTVSTLGELVRDQRKQCGWSQSQLAEKIGVSRLWVGQFENGKETVELGLVLRALRALDLTLEAGLLKKNPFTEGFIRITPDGTRSRGVMNGRVFVPDVL